MLNVKVRRELESSKEEYKVLMDRLLASEKNAESEKSWRYLIMFVCNFLKFLLMSTDVKSIS